MHFGVMERMASRFGLSRPAFPTIFGFSGWTRFVAAGRFPPGRKMRA
jgi:hypothetical protein